MEDEEEKIILIGIDGATWDLLEPWARSGKLPNFKRLMDNGSYGILESTIPHISLPAWTSITTGKNPAKHGIFGFRSDKSEGSWKLRLNTSLNKKSKEIWDFLNNESIVVNVPLTYPPREINGVMVTGMQTPSINSEFTYPKELKDEILRLFPSYKITLNWSVYAQQEQKFLEDLYQMTEERIKLFWYFFNTDWIFLFFVFTGSDRLQHLLWREDILLEYYKYLDNFLGEVIERIENNNINLLLVSDHGFSKIKKIVNVNALLAQNGFLTLKTSRKRNSLSKLGITKEKLRNPLTKYGIIRFYEKLPTKALDLIRKNVPGESNLVYDFDLENSQAAMLGIGSINILENDKQRKGEIKKEIIEKLENLRDPETGERIIEKVFKSEEIYSGNLMDKAPDLVLLPKKGYSLGLDAGNVLEKPHTKKADHDLNGIFLAYGPEIKRNNKVNAKVYDIAPTILHIFDLPVPESMDGKVLKEIFLEESGPAKREIKYKKEELESVKVKGKVKQLKKSGRL